MTTLFEKIIEKNKNAISFPIQGYWLDIGRPDDYHIAIEKFKEDKNFSISSYYFFKGAALGELRRFAEASVEFDLALNGIEPTSESSRFSIALYSMHKGASQVRANIEGGKELLKTAIKDLESSELSPFVTKSNSNKIQELKGLLKD